MATAEPVGDFTLTAAGVDNRTPFSRRADIMNGVDPAPQAVTLQNRLFSGHRVRAFVYDQPVTDSVTRGFLAAAGRAHVPVVGVDEPFTDDALERAVARVSERVDLRVSEHEIVLHGTCTACAS